jgi:GT2 family glycosyltransferase
MEVKNISIVIPSYNGKELLKRYLPSILNAGKGYSLDKTEFIIVDDASSDGTVEYLKSNCQAIRVIEHSANKGFSISANQGILAARNRIVVLLNNDVEIAEDFFLFLPGHFEEEAIFAVRPRIRSGIDDGGNSFENPRIGGKFRYGFIHVPVAKRGNLRFSFFAGGGAAAFDKEKFEELGGFDEMFSPFYFEDVDLSYRAWKRGWRTIYEPRSLAHHQGGATISKYYPRRRIRRIAERNKYFLVWKNVTDKKLLLRHVIFIPVRIFAFLVRGKFTPLLGFFSALKKIRPVIKQRRILKQAAKSSDKEILSLFKE